MHLVWGFVDVAIWLGKDKLLTNTTVGENTVLASCVVVACGVIFTIKARIEGGIHEEVGHSVDHSRNHITKLSVYSPHMNANGNLNRRRGGIIVVGIEVAVIPLVTLCDIAFLVYLVVDLGT